MNLVLDFRHLGSYSVELPGTTDADYEQIINILQKNINNPNIKAREVVAEVFLQALVLCPNENPSDLWHHVIYRSYLRSKTGSNPEQSWVRTSGEGFEIALARRYNPILIGHGFRLNCLLSRNDKIAALDRMGISGKVGSSKVDIIIEATGRGKSIVNGWGIIGGIHAKASLAERVSDDIPASRIMMKEGLLSILSTLDVKSFPPPHGDLVNRGELGTPAQPSDKRKYIEYHGDFNACFSYNFRTAPSNGATASGKSIYIANMTGGNDTFVDYLIN